MKVCESCSQSTGFAAGMESLEKVWISFLRIPDLEIVWKLMKSFGKRWRVLENSFFEKDVFFFFEPASDRDVHALPTRPGLGEAMHVRPDRVMSWSVGSLPIQAGAGSTSACFHVLVDRGHRLEHATVITRTVDYKEGGRNAFDCVSLFLTWRSIFFAFLGSPRLALLEMGKCKFSTLWLSDDRFKVLAFACPWEK